MTEKMTLLYSVKQDVSLKTKTKTETGKTGVISRNCSEVI